MAVTDEAILKIKSMIRDGTLRPGDRLPPEKELSDALGLSRNSLREAVKALEVIRVLDVRRGDGTYVTSLTPDLLLDAMSFIVEVNQDSTLIELMEVRRILEPAAAAWATTRAGPADVERLRDLLRGVGADTPVEDLVAHDVRFHRAITEIAGNAYLTGLLDTLSHHTVRARVWRGLSESGAVHRTIDEHRAIVAALADGDAALVAALSTVHVNGVLEWSRRAVDARDRPSP